MATIKYVEITPTVREGIGNAIGKGVQFGYAGVSNSLNILPAIYLKKSHGFIEHKKSASK